MGNRRRRGHRHERLLDCRRRARLPPFLTTCRGIDEGMPRLLELFEQEQVRGTFFITGDIARRFPGTVAAIRDGGHEIGCHGDTHTPFDTLDEATARLEIQASSAVLREFGPVTSFRARTCDFRIATWCCWKRPAIGSTRHRPSTNGPTGFAGRWKRG